MAGEASINWTLVLGTVFSLGSLSLLCSFGHAHLLWIPVRLIGANKYALWMYALFILPGTLLHEVSHASSAFVLGVEVRDFSIRPSIGEGGITLGYVRSERVDLVRHTLIGMAPLLTGILAILLIGLLMYDLGPAQAYAALDNWPKAIETLVVNFGSWKGWVATYLVFVISATMFPSQIDRQGCLPTGALLSTILITALLGNFGSLILEWIAGPLNVAFRWLFLSSAFTLVIDFVIVFLLTSAHATLVRRQS